MILSYGELVAISHPMPAWGQGGEVVDWDEISAILTLSEPVRWSEGSAFKPPTALTVRVEPALIPAVVTYKAVAEMWTLDRSALAICNGRLEEIEALGRRNHDGVRILPDR